MSKTKNTFKKITSLLLSLVLVLTTFAAVPFIAKAKVMNWSALASSDFTSVDSVSNDTSFTPAKYNNLGSSTLSWTAHDYSGAVTKAGDNIYIPEGYMYMNNTRTFFQNNFSNGDPFKIDFGFRFHDNSSSGYTAEDTYCFLKMFVYTWADNIVTQDNPIGTVNNLDKMYGYCMFAQDATGKVWSWNSSGQFGSSNSKTRVTTGSDYLEANKDYHYVIEFDGTRVFVYISDNNGVAVSQILASSNTSLINNLKNTDIVSALKIGDDNDNYFFQGLEYRNFTIYTGAETHDLGSSNGQKYLFAYFTGNADHTVQDWDSQAVRYALSEDGRHFTSINGNMAVVDQQLGTKNNRDPYVFAGQDGYYYMIATDMDCNLKADGTKGNDWYWWGNSDSMVLWRSTDLINWTDETIINMSEITGADDIQRCWAPQVIWDATAQKYAVYFGLASWSITQNATVTYYCYTDDLLDQSSYEYPVEMLNPGTGAIDGDIVYNTDNSTYYMYYKNEDAGSIRYAVSSTVTGPYTDKGNVLSAADWYAMGGAPTLAKASLEGSACYFVGDELYMMMDNYENGKMILLKSSDFENFQVLNESDYNTNGFSTTRHASVIQVSDAQYNALIAAYGDVHYTFHENFDVHDWADAHVDPSGFQYDAKTNKSISDSHIYAFENSNYLSIYKGNLFVEDWTVRHLMSGNSWTMSVNAMVTTKSSTATPILSLTSGASESANKDWFRILDNGKITIYDGSSDVEIGETNIDVAVEYTFHVTYDGTDLKVYKNGSLVCTRTNWTNNFKVTDSKCFIGVGFSDRTNSSTDYFRGTIADLRFRMHALSPGEVSSEYSDNLFYTAEGNETLDDLPNSISSKYDGSYRSGKANSLTIAGWVNPGAAADSYELFYIFGGGGDGETGQYLTLREGGNLNYLWGDGTNQHKVDITGVATYTANKWTYIQINIIPYRNSVRITTWQDGTQTTDTYCTDTGTNMSGYDYLPISMFSNKTTQDSLPVRYQQNPTSAHGWWNGNGYSNGITVYGRAKENLYDDEKDAFDVAIAKNYVENHIESYDVDAAANKATRNAYHYTDTAIGGFANVLASSYNSQACNDVWKYEFKNVRYAVFYPNDIALMYDGVNTPALPVQLEMHGRSTDRSCVTVYCSNGNNGQESANFHLAHYWTGWQGTYTTWTGTSKTYTGIDNPNNENGLAEAQADGNSHIGYYPGWQYDFSFTPASDDSGQFFWNKLYYKGTPSGYSETLTGTDTEMRGYAFSGSDGGDFTIPNATHNVYIVNYKPVYDILKSSGATAVPNHDSFTLKTLYDEVEANPTLYTEDSVNDFYVAAYKVLSANPNQYSEATYQADFSGTVDLAAAKIEEAVDAFNAIELKLRADFTDLDSKYANAQNIVATLNTNNQAYTTSSINALRTVVNNLVYEPNDGDPYRPNVEAFSSSSAIIAEKDAIDDAVAALDPIYDFDKHYSDYLFPSDYDDYTNYNEIWQYSTDILDTKGNADTQVYTTTTIESLGTVITNCYYAPVLNRVADRKDIGENKDGAAIAAEVNAIDNAIAYLANRADFSGLDSAYDNADVFLTGLVGKNAQYKKASLQNLIDAVDSASDDKNKTTAERLDTPELSKQTTLTSEANAITEAISALTNAEDEHYDEIDLAAFNEAYDKMTVNLDNDAFNSESSSISTAKTVVAEFVPTSTVSYGTSTIKVVDNEVSQGDVNLAIYDVLTALANSVKTYTIDVNLNGELAGDKVEISANDSTITDNKVTYGSKLTLTNKASNPDETAWYMNFDSSAVGEGKRTEQYIGEGARVKTTALGNMHIRAVSKTDSTPNKVTVKRKYKGDSTKSPIVCVDYVDSSYTLPASQVIPGYTFDGYTYENGDEITGSTASISGNTVIIANYSQSQSIEKYDVVVKDESGVVIEGYDFTGLNAVPYNTKVEVSYPDAAGWVEKVGDKYRLFHIGSELTFFVTESHEIKAITSLDGYTTYPVINIKNSAPIVASVDGGKKKIIFNAQVISGSANVLEYGILLGRGDISDSELLVENAGSTTGILRAKSTKLVGADQFTISVTTGSSGTVSYRAYATYQVGEGESAEIITVYTDVKTATV